MKQKYICPDCGTKILGPSYPKLHTCRSVDLIKKLRADSEQLRAAAKKLCNCFPEKIEGEEQKFDIPRYIIDELENVLENILKKTTPKKNRQVANSCVPCAAIDGDCCGVLYWTDDGKFLCNECMQEFDIEWVK